MKRIFSILSAMAAVFAMSSCNQNANQAQCDDCCCDECCECCENPAKLLVVVDVQRDFFDPAGSLYVGGSEVLPAKIAAIADNYDGIIFTLDWHPGNHCSFAPQGGPWPSHCVAYTQGAGLADEFAGILATDKAKLFFKGNDVDKEQYGAFEDLSEGCIYNWITNAESIDVCGIAGDYCVKESTANILKLASAEKVAVLMDCVRSIDDGSTIEAFVAENGIARK